jgi:amino acid transporter
MFGSFTDTPAQAQGSIDKGIDKGTQYVRTASNEDEDASAASTAGAKLLRGLGYEQKLYRGLDSIMTFSFGFSQVSCYLGILSLFTFGLETGGPVTMVWGWVLGSIFTCIVGACLAEICSAYPSAGSVYYWAGQLAAPKDFACASYWAGYFNLVGNVTAIPATAYMVALFIEACLVVNGHTNFGSVYRVLFTIVIMFTVSAFNFLRIDQIGWISVLGAVVQVTTMVVIIIVVLSMTPAVNTWHFVLFDWSNETGFNAGYVVVISVLFPLFSFVGYDASSHMAEEAHNSAVTAPWALFNTCTSAVLSGMVFIIAILFACLDVSAALNSDLDNAGLAIILAATNGTVATCLFGFLAASAFFASLSTTSVAARMTFACVRDGMAPYHEILSYVDPTHQTPVAAIIFNLVCNTVIMLGLMLPLCAVGQDILAFNSLAAVVTLGFQISYAIPIGLKAFNMAEHPFPACAFTLGSYSTACGCAALTWLVATACIFMLPLESPITGETMNYAVAVVAIVTVLGYFNWLYVSTRKVSPFVGPKRAAAGAAAANGKAAESTRLL